MSKGKIQREEVKQKQRAADWDEDTRGHGINKDEDILALRFLPCKQLKKLTLGHLTREKN